jgi:hypothetical protein
MRNALLTEVFLPTLDGLVTRLRHALKALHKARDEILVVALAAGPPEYVGTVLGVSALYHAELVA